MSDSSLKPSAVKPPKPYEGFPLFAHPSGMWAKKIGGKLVYFESWRSDPEGTAALERFNREWPYLKEGRTPPPIDIGDGLTVRRLCNLFLSNKEEKIKAGDLSPRTFRDYYSTCEGLLSHFGKDRRVDDIRPQDFQDLRAKLAKRLQPGSLKKERTQIKLVFNFAFDNGLIEKPVTFGQYFDPPGARLLRKSRNEAGPNLFTRDELIRILAALEGNPTLRAMVLLGINCGFGNTDVASLPQKAVDLDNGWVNFPRPKTEVNRRIPLWPETIAALRAALAHRPTPADPADGRLCFLTNRGRPWVRFHLKKRKPNEESKPNDESKPGPQDLVPIDALSSEFKDVLKSLDINGRKGLGFYTLRHCFETRAGESKDQVAVNAVMGHADSSMAAHYREGISDSRLQAVVNVVHSWLYPSEKKEGGAS